MEEEMCVDVDCDFSGEEQMSGLAKQVYKLLITWLALGLLRCVEKSRPERSCAPPDPLHPLCIVP